MSPPPAAFNSNPSQQLDRNIRTLPSDFAELRLDPVNTLNVALVKNTSIARTTLQLRAETFNAFDRVQFNAPVPRQHPATSGGSPARRTPRARCSSPFA